MASASAVIRAAIAGVMAFGLAEGARAQSSGDDGAAEEVILVTAQKRSEAIQAVPISIAAFDSAKLIRSNVRTLQDLGRITPNLQINRGAQSAFHRLTIRGIGAASNTTIEPSVAAFVDGVYVPRAGAIVGAMLDVEAVEILRGPQGTLFGRNASVGALTLRSVAPKPELSAAMTAEVGNADRYKLYGHFNLPLGGGRSFRLAGMAQWFGGYWRNRFDGKHYGGSDEIAVRGSYRLAANSLEWIVRFDYARTVGDGASNIDFDPTSVSAAQLDAFRLRLGGMLPDTNLRDRIMNQSTTADLNDRQWGLSSTLSLDLDGGTVRLIDSYRDWKNEQIDGDLIFTPAPILSRLGRFGSKSHNHELQYISPRGEWLGGRFDLVGGLYYFSEDYRLVETLRAREQSCNIVIPVAQRPACTIFLARFPGADSADQRVRQKVASYAGYGQLNWHVADQWTLTLGGRYTADRKTGRYVQIVPNPFVSTLRAPEALTLPKIRDERFTYRLGVDYHPNRAMLVYASYSTGYKSAGYNSGGGAQPLSTFDASGKLLSTKRAFDRETTENVELGAKTSWLAGKLIANLTLYRMTIKGYQDRAFDGVSFSVFNAGKLRQQGFEMDMTLIPAERLRLISAIAYLDSEFLSYPNAPGLPGLGGIQDLRGKPATYSPRWSGRVALEYGGDLGAGGPGWTISTNLAFTSKQFYGLITDANPQTIQKGYRLLGARFTVNGPDDHWSVALFGNNLTNRHISVGNFYQVLDAGFGLRNGVFPGSSAVRVNRADPRSYGISASISL
jgi:iron complex outermembrane receptor protein